MKRCPECGSWEAECGSPVAVPGCGCARCLCAELAETNAILQDPKKWMMWCDNRMLEDNEKLRAELAVMSAELSGVNWTATARSVDKEK